MPAGIREHDPDAKPASPSLFAGSSTWICPFDELGRNRFNPREQFDRKDLDELGEGLKRDGQVQAILVRKAPSGSGVKSIKGALAARFEIVAGERRALAAFHAGLRIGHRGKPRP